MINHQQDIICLLVFSLKVQMDKLEKLLFNSFGCVSINHLGICITHLDIYSIVFFLNPAFIQLFGAVKMLSVKHIICILITLCTSVPDMTFN